MICRTLALPVACAGALCAQQPIPEVQDLLMAEAARSRVDASSLVRRAPLKDRLRRRHIVSGEGHLGVGSGSESTLRAPLPFFDQDSLIEVLGALLSRPDDPLEFVRIGERVQVRSQYVEQLDVALAAVRAALPPRVRCSFRLERLVNSESAVLLTATEVFANGETVAVGDVEHATLVTDVEVEVAQAAAAGNPVTTAITYGASALLRVRPIPGRDAAVVEVVVRTAAPFDAPQIPASAAIGAFDRVASRFDEAGLVFRVARGATSTHAWTAIDGSSLRLTCAVDWTPASAATDLLCNPLLHEPVLGFRSTRAGEPDEPGELLPVVDIIASQLAAGDDSSAAAVRLVSGGHGGVALLLRGEQGRQQADRLFRSIDDALQPVTITLEAYDVPAGTTVPARGAPPSEATLLWRLGGPGLVGLPSCLASGRERSYLRDWDIEVAQGARIADPKIAICEDGWFATVKPLPATRGKPRRVELAVDLIHFVELRQLKLAISSAAVAATKDSTVMLPAQAVPVEQPVTRVGGIGAAVTLDEEGAAVLRRAAARLLGPGRELVLRVRVE